MTEIQEFLTAEIKNLAFKSVKTDEALVSSGILDSIAIVDLAVAIEEKYKIKIPFNEIAEKNFETIEIIIKFLALPEQN